MKNMWRAAILAMCVCALAGCKKAEEKPGIETEAAGTQEEMTDLVKDDASKETSKEQESQETEATETETDGEYIFPESDTRLLTSEELSSIPANQLRLARNEIFARRGRLFTSAELQEYFESKDWYEGTIKPEEFSDSMLSEIEKENIDLIKAREELGDILDTAAAYKKIMDENQLFGWNGLLDYGRIEVSMSDNYADWYPALEDKGGYYEAKDQILCVPVYYDWDEVEAVKEGDKLTLSFGMLNESAVYTVTDILQEHGKEAKVISVFAPEQYGEMQLVFTDAFHVGKYVLAIVDEIVGDNYVIWNSDDISCACDTLYAGSFYLSKDCVIDVAGQMRSVEDQRELDWEKNPFGGAIFGNILDVDANGLITRIQQQVAG